MDIGIIDDDIEFLKLFKPHLEKQLSKYFSDYKIDCIQTDYSKCLKTKNYDIIFMDIDLRDISGINLVFSMKKNNINPIVIFVSSHPGLVFDALSVQPFQFIRKSYLLEDLMLTLSLLYDYYKERSYLLTLNLYGRKTSIKIKDLIYLQSDAHEINIITKEDCYVYRITMKNILSMINNSLFIQIQKSISVNFDYVVEVNQNGDVVLKNGNVFSINRYYKKIFFEKYKEYLLL